MEMNPKLRLSEIAQTIRNCTGENPFEYLCQNGCSPKEVADAIEDYLGCSTMTDYLVAEVCPHCESEIEMRWSVKDLGYKAICPVCGNRLMLCDECRHRGPDGEYIPGGCDYDGKTDTCHFNQAGSKNSADGYASANRKAEFSYLLEFAASAEFDGSQGVQMRQLRALWSAYCLRHNRDVDTRQYKDDLTILWDVVKGNPDSEYTLEQSNDFDHYMRQDIL